MYTVKGTIKEPNVERTFNIEEQDAYAIARQVLRELREEVAKYPQRMNHIRDIYVDFYANFIDEVIATAGAVVNAQLDAEGL